MPLYNTLNYFSIFGDKLWVADLPCKQVVGRVRFPLSPPELIRLILRVKTPLDILKKSKPIRPILFGKGLHINLF